jgi:hypothetical protein
MEDMIFFYFTASVISSLNFSRKCLYTITNVHGMKPDIITTNHFFFKYIFI